MFFPRNAIDLADSTKKRKSKPAKMMKNIFKSISCFNTLKFLKHHQHQHADGFRTLSTSSYSMLLKQPSLSPNRSRDQAVPILSPHGSIGAVRYFSLGSDPRKMYSTQCPFNYGILIVPEKQAYVVERFGKFLRLLSPGFHFLIPFVDKVAYAHSLKEEAISIP